MRLHCVWALAREFKEFVLGKSEMIQSVKVRVEEVLFPWNPKATISAAPPDGTIDIARSYQAVSSWQMKDPS